MLRNLVLSLLLVSFAQLSASQEYSKYFVFVGKKMSLEYVPPKEGEPPFDAQFFAKYRVLKPVRGIYNEAEIEFSVFDHYGTPPFSKYQHVLLYVVRHEGKYYHSKYQYSPLYKSKDGKWASPYAAYDYTHEYNKDTNIRPVKIDFSEPVVMDISNVRPAAIEKWFPEPYFKIDGNKATAIYGNYIEELFLLKQNGVLKARGDFQN